LREKYWSGKYWRGKYWRGKYRRGKTILFVILLLLRAGESTDSDPYNFETYNGVNL